MTTVLQGLELFTENQLLPISWTRGSLFSAFSQEFAGEREE